MRTALGQTWLCIQLRGSSLVRKFLRLRRAPTGRAKGMSPSWPPPLPVLLPVLPSLELLLELLELDRVARVGERWWGATEEEGEEAAVEEEVAVGGCGEHWRILPTPPTPPTPPPPLLMTPRPRKLLSLASSDRVRGRKRVFEEEEEDGEAKEGESAAQPWWREQGLVLQRLSLSDARLACEESRRPWWRPGLRRGEAGERN